MGWDGTRWGEFWSGLSYPGVLDAVCPAPSDGSCFLLPTTVQGQLVRQQLVMSCSRLPHYLLGQAFILSCFIF